MPEVKDTVQKHSLLYHLTFTVLESLPTASDLYSEVGGGWTHGMASWDRFV